MIKQMYYVVSYLTRTWRYNLIKVLTLTLGLTISLILFARIAFDLSYERFLPNAENIYQVQTTYTTGVGTSDASSSDYSRTFQPVAPTMPLEIPGVIAGTSLIESAERMVFDGENRYEVKTIYADTMFFKTLPFEILSGDEMGLKTAGNVFLSRSLAKRIFSDQNPVGKILFDDKKHLSTLTVIGVFEDVPEDSHLDFDLIYSIANSGNNNWNGRDGYTGYVRLQPNADLKSINEKAIPEMLARHMNRKSMKEKGYAFDCYLKPIVKLHIENKETKQALIVLSILATLILIAISLNYVMMSISSLASRARTMAIYKSNGATSSTIFIMSLTETVILVLVSLIFTTLLILFFDKQIEMLTGVSLGSLFGGTQLWISLGLVLLVIVLSGVIPARIFSSIPVTRIFHFSSDNKHRWKQGLLGVQIASAAFMLTFLGIIFMQYNLILHKDLGYNPQNLVYCQIDSIPHERRQMVKTELMRLPEIQNISFSTQMICVHYSGGPMIDPKTKEAVTTLRSESIDSSFVNTLGLRIRQGNNIPHGLSSSPTPCLVNKHFLELLGWENDPIGRTYQISEDWSVVINGVLDDFVVGTIFSEQTPVCLYGMDDGWGWMNMTVRFQEMSPETISLLENRLRELLPEEDIVLKTYRDTIHASYRDTERFRNSVAIASVFMLLITLMGLIGYVADEIRRRSKEIAIRKINGATAPDVLRLLLRNILYMGIPSILLGLIGTYLAGSHWLEHFPDKVSLNLILFILSGLALLIVISFCVITRSWMIANENPVNSLKSE